MAKNLRSALENLDSIIDDLQEMAETRKPAVSAKTKEAVVARLDQSIEKLEKLIEE